MLQSNAKYTDEEREIIKRFLLDRRESVEATCQEVHVESKGAVGRWERGTLRYYKWYDAVIRHMLATIGKTERANNAKTK